ncbi:MAG: hypothetical protein LBT38_07000 [Deltaproteobacteria bacterium]|jgi:hypothetical protein|nr:hypothetical protein [Deltaproteobacteria bacterium]
MKKHLIKLAILLPGLAILVWWGWVGNFSFSSGSFYPFEPRQDYYALVAGQKTLGFSKRLVTLDQNTKNLTLTEDTVINLSLLITEGEIRCRSTAVFSSSGPLLSSRLTIDLLADGKPLADVTSSIKDGQLHYRFQIGQNIREITKPIPESGPILISGLIPWLARQRDLPLGRPIFFSLFDPSKLEFRPASLTIIDVSSQAAEKKVYKLALFMDPDQTDIWVQADGQVISQKATGLKFGIDVLTDPNRQKEAQLALAAPPKPGILKHVPRALLDMIINQGVGALWPDEAEANKTENPAKTTDGPLAGQGQ